MRSIWKGSISFGLVYIPIAVYPATREEKLSFRQLRTTDLSPIRYKKVADADQTRTVSEDRVQDIVLAQSSDVPPTALRAVYLTGMKLSGNLVSPDETATVVVAEFDDRLTDVAIAARLEELVSNIRDDSVTIALIPETREATTLGDAAPGRRVNVEVDILAKHLERLVRR